MRKSSNTLIIIDEQPIRADLLKELKKLQKTYLRLRSELDRHKKIVRPSYYAWYQKHFEKRALAVEKMRAEFQEKGLLLRRMQDLYTWRGMTRQKAFAQAQIDLDLLKKRNAQEDSDQDSAKANEETTDFRARNSSDDSADVKSIKSKVTERDLEVKSFYRKLARALHPDQAGEFDETFRLLWQETQDAYHAGDLERLKLIWAECIIELDPGSGRLRIADLKAAMRRLSKKVKDAQNEKRDLSRSDLTWGFDRKNKDLLAREISSELFEAETDLSSSIKVLDREIRAFSRTYRNRVVGLEEEGASAASI